MVKKQKLLEKAKRNPQELQFSEFENLLSLCCWTLRRQTGSSSVWVLTTAVPFINSTQKRWESQR